MLQLSLAFASLWRRLRAWPRKMLPAVRYLDSGLLDNFFFGGVKLFRRHWRPSTEAEKKFSVR